jgi:hypothetical protein
MPNNQEKQSTLRFTYGHVTVVPHNMVCDVAQCTHNCARQEYVTYTRYNDGWPVILVGTMSTCS